MVSTRNLECRPYLLLRGTALFAVTTNIYSSSKNKGKNDFTSSCLYEYLLIKARSEEILSQDSTSYAINNII